MRRSAWATAALAISATLVVAACGSSHSSAASSPTSSSPATSTATSTATAGTGTKTLGCMVTDTGGINDRSFNASSWAGMQAASAANPNMMRFLACQTYSRDSCRAS